ncbi:hypothetical protein M3226_24395 [Neobacillus cucumis]|uniref:hypothetical protein n=1 Tax=Neobacillus cucumis TaxID=1740721 RepID=UPI00203DF8EC|nr:hypothetical protein [Neobacillus cucumis]MCM3728788.1 hypothetical protein [Neobacillus cucumis]
MLDNILGHCSRINCNEGLNTLRMYAVSPGFVLEKRVIYPKKRNLLLAIWGRWKLIM